MDASGEESSNVEGDNPENSLLSAEIYSIVRRAAAKVKACT